MTPEGEWDSVLSYLDDSNVFVADYAGEEAAGSLREDPGAFAMEYSRYDWRVEPREERPWEERSGP